MNSSVLWPLAMLLGGALNFAFQYLLLFFEERVEATLAQNLNEVRARFAERNGWALLMCAVGFLWAVQELALG